MLYELMWLLFGIIIGMCMMVTIFMLKKDLLGALIINELKKKKESEQA